MSKPFDATLANGDVFCGTANRFIKLGFITINVYAFGLYVEPAGLHRCLATEFAGQSAGQLARNHAFYHAFVSAKFRKTFVLTMCRTLPRAKMVASFTKSLLSRVDVEYHAEARSVIERLVPGEFKEDDQVKLTMEADGETIAGAVNEVEVFRIASPGANGIWAAFQNIFYDLNTEVHDIKKDSVVGVPELLAAAESARADREDPAQMAPAVESVQVSQALVVGTSSDARPAGSTEDSSWRRRAGRQDGSESYQFGDLSRAILRKVFGGADPDPAEGCPGSPAKSAPGTPKVSDAEAQARAMARENAALKEAVARLEGEAVRVRAENAQLVAQAFVVGAFELCCVLLVLIATLPEEVSFKVVIALWSALAISALEVLKGDGAAPGGGSLLATLGRLHRDIAGQA